MCIYIYIYIYTYIHVHIHTYTSTYTYIYIYIDIHVYIYIYIYTHVCIHIYTYIYIYIYTCAPPKVSMGNGGQSMNHSMAALYVDHSVPHPFAASSMFTQYTDVLDVKGGWRLTRTAYHASSTASHRVQLRRNSAPCGRSHPPEALQAPQAPRLSSGRLAEEGHDLAAVDEGQPVAPVTGLFRAQGGLASFGLPP